MGVKVFFLEPTGKDQRSLRRYAMSSERRCPVHGYHDARVPIGIVPHTDKPHEVGSAVAAAEIDGRWPTKCDCGYEFKHTDEWQDFHNALFRRTDTGEEITLRDAPPGACWDATWYHDMPDYRGPDGRSLIVVCPDGHQWCIDSRASNCTMKDDHVHKCWVRHGSPEAGNLHVDKNGLTCNAGAGSIDTGTWHGFLHNGELVVA